MENTVPVFEHIWLADDDRDDCEFFQDVLKQVLPSSRLTIVNGVNELLQLIDVGDKPDMLFIDMIMPAKNGPHWLPELRMKPAFSKLPIVADNGSLYVKHIHRAYNSGADLFYPKPTSLQELAKGLSALFMLDWNDPAAITQAHFVNNRFVPFAGAAPA